MIDTPVELSTAGLLVRLDAIEAKLDELLADSRAARPLLERYLKFAGGWKGLGKRG